MTKQKSGDIVLRLRERAENGQTKIGDTPALRERQKIAKPKIGVCPALRETKENGQTQNWR